jgi:hypothetical protein
MKKVFRFIGYGIGVIIILLLAAVTYVKTALPDVGAAENITIPYTPERIEHGRYLATAVSVCMDCHSKRDFTKFSGPLAAGTLGMGGERFDQSVGMPGVFYSKNITPDGIQRYTDGELLRVITTGVNKEGKAMFPLMPYPYYGRMDREDIFDIIAYIRSIKPIVNDVPQSVPDFPMSIIINMIPKKAAPQRRPDKSDVLAYGAYMTNASGCRECHTQVSNGQIIPDLAFGGGREFQFPDGTTVRSSNITPDDVTGIGKWSREAFIQRFKIYADSSIHLPAVTPGEFNSIMPWTMYGQMDRDDLGAIYTYLRSVPPIPNAVNKFSPGKK